MRSTTCFVFAEEAALPKHGVNECGLAVIDVRDDGDIADKRVAVQSFFPKC